LDAESLFQIPLKSGADTASMTTLKMFEYRLGRQHAMILGLFENRDATEVGVGEKDSASALVYRFGQSATLFRKNGADRWTNHGMAHAHDVNARDALTDVRMDAFELVKDGFFPVRPVFLEEELAIS
jgi:hypothetical protein